MARQPVYLLRMDEWLRHLSNRGYAEYTVKKSYRFAVQRAYRVMKEAGYPTAPSLIDEDMASYVITTAFHSRGDGIAAWNNFLKYCKNPVVELLEFKAIKGSRINVDWLNLETQEDRIVWEHSDHPMEIATVHFELHLRMRRSEVRRFELPSYKNTHLDILGKGKKLRTIPAHPLTADVMATVQSHRYKLRQELIDRGVSPALPDNLLTIRVGDEARVPSLNLMDKWLKNVGKRCGIKFSHHTLRRTGGRKLWKAGVKIETIAEYLGHNSTDQTKKYLGIGMADLDEAMELEMKYEMARQNPQTPKLCTETR